MLTDPPYGENHSSGWVGKFQNESIKNDDGLEFRDSVLSLWDFELPAAIFGKWSVPKFGTPRGVVVWDKGPASGMGDLSFPFKPSWEDIAIYGEGWKGSRDEGVIKGHTVVTWSGNGQRKHPNEKPLTLIQLLLSKLPTAQSILDPFIGSGTTLVAAKLGGIKATGIEINERYCEIAVNRLRQGVLDF